jgi:hypothetical protein
MVRNFIADRDKRCFLQKGVVLSGADPVFCSVRIPSSSYSDPDVEMTCVSAYSAEVRNEWRCTSPLPPVCLYDV